MLGMSMVQEVCDIMDDLAVVPNNMEGHREPNEPEPHQGMENLAAETFEEFVANGVNNMDAEINALKKETCQPLYLGTWSTMLAATMLLLNITMVHGVSDKFVDELLSLLNKHILPKGLGMLGMSMVQEVCAQRHPCTSQKA